VTDQAHDSQGNNAKTLHFKLTTREFGRRPFTVFPNESLKSRSAQSLPITLKIGFDTHRQTVESTATIKPSAMIATTAVSRPDAAPVRQAVQTELAAPKAVTAAVDSTRPQTAAFQQPRLTREVFVDAQTREVIFRVIDERSRRVVRQMPDEALLRMRAYNQALVNGETPTEARAMADQIG